jgi:hypothetical protein
MSFEILDKKVSESAPLLDRLDDCMTRIGKMCSEGRPPKMTIPCQWNDDDIFITATIKEAVEQLRAADGLTVAALDNLSKKIKKTVGKIEARTAHR